MKRIQSSSPNAVASPDAVLIQFDRKHTKQEFIDFALGVLGTERDEYWDVTVRYFEDDEHVLVRFHKE